MEKRPRHRPERRYPEAKRQIFVSELNTCVHCGAELKLRPNWHVRKTIQTLNGLDVLAYIGWQHDHEHKQLVEIQGELNRLGLLINERNTGKLYRQFLAFLGVMSEGTRQKLAETSVQHGGLIWALDALQPEGDGILLYVLYEVLSSTPVGAIQLSQPTGEALTAWSQPYRDLPYPVLATLSDGEKAIIEALQASWPQAPHQRCQAHFLNNLADDVFSFAPSSVLASTRRVATS